jgi:hypothetical protein
MYGTPSIVERCKPKARWATERNLRYAIRNQATQNKGPLGD